VDRELIAQYVHLLRKTNQDLSIVTSLHHLRFALRLICPKQDWSWLLTINKRIASAAPRRPKKLGLVTSDQLYLLGIELMDTAIAKAGDSTAISKATAMQYRDGLLIALLSVLALRRRTVTALKSGGQLLRSGNLRTIEIPPEDVKGKRALDFTLSLRLSECVDLYLRKFRLLPGAIRHDGFWPSNKGGPMSANAIYDAVCKRTESAFGFRVTRIGFVMQRHPLVYRRS
jgi:hypothetical protein